MLHKRRGIILTCLGTALLLAVLYNYTTRPVYRATTQILIDRDTPNVLPSKELVELVQGGADYYQTQYQLLKGRSLAERAVERLKLQTHPELATGPMMNPWERVRGFFGRPPSAVVDTSGLPLSPAAAAFRSRIEVDPIPGSRLVNLHFRAYDPQVAADAVNTLAQLYIQQSLELRFTTSTEATGWLSDRLREQEAKVAAAEQALQEYRERQGLVNQEDRQGLVEQKLETLNGAVLDARTERIAKESLYTQLAAASPAQIESFPLVVGSEAVQALKAELAALRKDEARLDETLGDRHPDMVRVRSQIRSTEEKIRAEIRAVARAAESEYRTALAKEARLAASLEAVKGEAQDTSRKTIEYGALRREVETNRQLYQDLLTKTKQAGLETELKTTNIRVVEKAETPRGPISPNRLRNYQVALILGLLIGVGLALGFEHLDNTFKTPDDVREHLGVPFLGMVPDADGKGGGGRPGGAIVLRNPNSAAADAYRVLRTNLIFSSAQTSGRAIVVSSASPGEGKTTTVANLAAALAHNGAKVLAVDADLRRPTLHTHFGLQKTPGLSDLIVGKSAAAQAIQTTRVNGLQLLACGYQPPNPAELLGSPMMKQVLEALRAHYDWVLIDSPPLLAMADTPVVASMVEGVVLVLAAESATKPAVARAIDQVRAVGGKVIGVVLNRVDLQRNSYYYSQNYGEYYRSYYAEGASPAKAGKAEEPARRPAARPPGRLLAASRPRRALGIVAAVVLPVVLAVVVRVALQVDLVEHHAQHFGADAVHLVDRPGHGRPRRDLGGEHEHHVLDHGRDHRRVGHRQDRRRVDQHPVVVRAQRLEELLHHRRAEEFRRVRRHVPARQHLQPVDARRLDGLRRLRLADDQVGEPGRLLQAEVLVQRRAAQVGVHCQHLRPVVRQGGREVRDRRRLALAGIRARYHDGATGRLRRREDQVRAQHAVGVGHRGTRAARDRDRVRPRRRTALHLDLGDHSEERQAEVLLHVVGCLERVVEVLEEEGEADAEEEPEDERHLVGPGPVGDDRASGSLGLLDDADVRRLQLGLEAGLLRLRQEVLVELPVRLDLAPEDHVVDRLPARELRLVLHRLEARREARFLGQRVPVLALRGAGDVADLGAQFVLGGPDVRAHAHHVGMPIAERVGEPRLLLLQRRQLDPERLHGLAREDEAEAVELCRRRARDLVVEALLRNPLGPGFKHGPVQRLELLLDEALLLLLVHEPLALPVLLERLLGGLDLRELLLEPVGEPAGGVSRGREAQLERLLDVELSKRVHRVGCDLRAVRTEVEVDEARAGHGLHLHPRSERGRGGR
jgi:capsular exopolysaccharide synthesis family protein